MSQPSSSLNVVLYSSLKITIEQSVYMFLFVLLTIDSNLVDFLFSIFCIFSLCFHLHCQLVQLISCWSVNFSCIIHEHGLILVYIFNFFWGSFYNLCSTVAFSNIVCPAFNNFTISCSCCSFYSFHLKQSNKVTKLQECY